MELRKDIQSEELKWLCHRYDIGGTIIGDEKIVADAIHHYCVRSDTYDHDVCWELKLAQFIITVPAIERLPSYIREASKEEIDRHLESLGYPPYHRWGDDLLLYIDRQLWVLAVQLDKGYGRHGKYSITNIKLYLPNSESCRC